MDFFKVVQIKPDPDPLWSVEWTQGGKASAVMTGTFHTEADAQRWVDRLNEVAGRGFAR
jgi:hypothetical protein